MSGGSRLSSLLVRDGLVGVKRMEQAFQRQVIYGGALDTILLEMGALGEDRLGEYLSLASGLPPADRNLVDYFDPRAVQVCPRELAEEFHVAPVAFDGDALRVLVSDPVDLGQLEALATRIGAAIQPFVVPEFRFNLVVERLFGVPTPSRYLLLAARQAAARRPALPEPTIIVEDVDIRRIAETPNVRTRTGPMSTDTVARALERQELRRKASTSAQPVTPSGPARPIAPAAPSLITPATSGVPDPVTDPARHAHRATSARSGASEPAQQVVTPRLRPDAGPGETIPQVVRGPDGTEIVRVPWRQPAGPDPSPLEPDAATQLLRHAASRDEVFHALIRGVRSRTRYAASLVVQGDVAFGREALGEAGADPSITQVVVPLGAVPAFRTAASSGSPYIGPIATGDAATDANLAHLGGLVPPTALLLPVVLKTRVVAVVYAHRLTGALSVREVAELLPLAGEASVALSRLILKAKAAGYGRAPEPSGPRVPVEEVPARPRRPPPDSGTARPAAAPPPSLGEDGPRDRDRHRDRDRDRDSLPPRAPIDQILSIIEAGGAPAAVAYDESVLRVDETLGALRRRLPGKLWVDRYASVRPSRASQHGPLLALLVRLGEKGVPVLCDLLGAEDRELRYYATLACVEVRHPQLVHPLATRLFDADHGVRAAAVDALAGYPARDTNHALEPVRNALHGDAARARSAAHALGELRDVSAVPDLVAAIERDHTTGEEARRALVQITKQDFALKAKKWRAWWDKNQERPRLEWMLDGLAHADELVRLSASEELKRTTGEYFGYHYDLPKREREEARAKWLKWWEEVGKRRFLRRDAIPEAERPTAMLPQYTPKRPPG